MDNTPRQKKDWVLTQEAFDELLLCLDADRERAGEKYEEIRQRLMKFFKWRGCARPEEYTDRTIDRAARRIAEGAELHTRDPYLYFHGVALYVLKEHWRETDRDQDSLADLPPSQSLAEHPDAIKERELERREKEERLECLYQCVQRLAPDNLELISQYHQGEEVSNKARRKELAARLKVPLNALRIRAYRIRVGLEACVDDCLKRESVK